MATEDIHALIARRARELELANPREVYKEEKKV